MEKEVTMQCTLHREISRKMSALQLVFCALMLSMSMIYQLLCVNYCMYLTCTYITANFLSTGKIQT